MLILKSPIINDGFFVLDSLCSIFCIYSLKNPDLSIQVDGMSHNDASVVHASGSKQLQEWEN